MNSDKEPSPAAMEFLAGPLVMYPNEYHAEVGSEGMGQAPVGTDPYKITAVDGVKRYLLERNDDYFAASPKGRPEVGVIKIRAVTDTATEGLERLSGQADWIWKFNADQFDKIDDLPNVSASRGEGDNPLSDQRVRQAINHAVNRDSLVVNLVQGDARVIDTPCYPGQFGCVVEASVHYDYDQEKARALLAEVGYPDGFSTELVGFRNSQWTAAIQSDLSAVGIDATTSMIKGAVLVGKTQKGELPLGHWDWGSFSINDVSAVLPNFFADGGYDRG